MLVRLLYASRSAKPVEHDVVESILAQSRRHNPELGVTGILCQSGELFMQVLEGGRAAVNQLYNQIVRDARHRDVVILHYEEITERHFSAWTMGQVNLAKVNRSTLLKYSETAELDPFAISGKVALALLDELIATAQIIGRTG
ncbi:MAG: BLUF domain-containing protein [Betaproteobacteria bacterium]|nr:MAG: BLUF domain-containing protein [Betaproteobacteria bacterium]